MISIQTYFLFGFVWCCWCGLHSYLISSRVTGWLEKCLGSNYRYYRLAYNLFSTISLSAPLLFGLYLRRHETVLLIWDGWPQAFRYVSLFLSFLLFYSAARHYKLTHFLGVTQIRTGYTSYLLGDTGDFATTGASGIVRHPWYLGGIILVWSVFEKMYPSTLISAIIITCYFVIGSVLEERKLLAHYGKIYRVYQERVSMLFPLKWLIARIQKNKIEQ